MKTFQFSMFAVAIAILSTAATADATLIYDPVSASDNNHYNSGPDNAASVNTINSTGLSSVFGTPGTSMAVPGSYPTNSGDGTSTAFDNGFAGQPGAIGPATTITYQLVNPSDPAVDLTGGHFRQYGGDTLPSSGRGARVGRYLRSSTAPPGSYTFAGTLNLGPSGLNYPELNVTSSTQDPGKDFSVSATNVCFIELTNMVAFNPGTGFVGFGEIRFAGSNVPEPGTLTLASLAAAALAWAGYKPARIRSDRHFADAVMRTWRVREVAFRD